MAVVVCSAFNLRVYHYPTDSDTPRYSTLHNVTGISMDSYVDKLATYFRSNGYHDTDGNENEIDLSNDTTFVTIYIQKDILTIRCYGDNKYKDVQQFMATINYVIER